MRLNSSMMFQFKARVKAPTEKHDDPEEEPG
jgi:hypothetical protein